MGILGSLWIWAVEIVNLLIGRPLVPLGILPRSASGQIGIPLALLIHFGVWHAVSNTVPLVILGALALAGGGKRFWQTTAAIGPPLRRPSMTVRVR